MAMMTNRMMVMMMVIIMIMVMMVIMNIREIEFPKGSGLQYLLLRENTGTVHKAELKQT
jgi:hypothetical protein